MCQAFLCTITIIKLICNAEYLNGHIIIIVSFSAQNKCGNSAIAGPEKNETHVHPPTLFKMNFIIHEKAFKVLHNLMDDLLMRQLQ